MNRTGFETWMKELKQAWEGREPEAAARLFSEQVYYRQNPFAAPLRGQEAVLNYWRMAARSQERVQFDYEVLAVTPEYGIARWWASFTRIPIHRRVNTDGICVVEMDADGRCARFREWWHTDEKRTV